MKIKARPKTNRIMTKKRNNKIILTSKNSFSPKRKVSSDLKFDICAWKTNDELDIEFC